MGKQSPPDEFDMRKAMDLAASPAGRQLLALLQTQSGPQLRQAMAKAAAGDYEAAKSSLSSLLEQPEVKKLLKQLEE